MFKGINHLAVITLVVLYQIIGFVWYSPLLFSDLWMKLISKTAADLDPSIMPFIISVIGALFINYFLAWYFTRLNTVTTMQALGAAFFLWLCIDFAENATFFSFHGFHFGVTLIDLGKSLVCFLFSAVILVRWKKKPAVA